MVGSKPARTARKIALAGALKNSHIRSICWKIFLGVYDPAEGPEVWAENAKRLREQYARDVVDLLKDPHDAEGMSIEASHPLAQTPESPWARYFQRSELEKDIQLDVVHTH